MRLLKKSAPFLIVVAMAAAGGASIVSASTTIDQRSPDPSTSGIVGPRRADGPPSGFGMSLHLTARDPCINNVRVATEGSDIDTSGTLMQRD